MRPSLDSYAHLAGGKVRDLYTIDDEHLLLVASDRISAYDHVLGTTIPDKGRVLTATTVASPRRSSAAHSWCASSRWFRSNVSPAVTSPVPA